MKQEDVVVLEWTFSPSDYFEDEIRFKRDDYEMIIGKGKVEAKVAPDTYIKNSLMRDELHRSLDDRFLGAQLVAHKPYELSKSSMYHLHPDGRRDITVFPESCILTLAVGTVDIIVKDKNGNVISDSRKDRIEEKKTLSELVEKYRDSDPTAASILRSYKTAVNDANNELVHLYEIRDALSRRFGGESAACQVLHTISTTAWSRLGQLANNEPLRQGRHRGKNPGILRDATDAELTEARKIARQFVEAYLEFLDGEEEK